MHDVYQCGQTFNPSNHHGRLAVTLNYHNYIQNGSIISNTEVLLSENT